MWGMELLWFWGKKKFWSRPGLDGTVYETDGPIFLEPRECDRCMIYVRCYFSPIVALFYIAYKPISSKISANAPLPPSLPHL
jgi:hypothetical protein